MMSESVHVGTSDLPAGVGWERYFSKLSFIETSVLAQRAARPSVLAKWRAAAPGPGSFAVVAPPIDAPIAPFLTAAAILEPAVLVFRTPASFSPSAHNRERLRAFFAEMPGFGTALPGSEALPHGAGTATRVWQPDGLWDTRTAVKLAGEMGVVFGVDPLVRDPTREPPDFFATLEAREVYFRVTGLGRGARKLASSQLEELHAIVEAYERSWLVFATLDPLADASRFVRGQD
jgi:uncharacterized protein YecE (DUF72 family)